MAMEPRALSWGVYTRVAGFEPRLASLIVNYLVISAGYEEAHMARLLRMPRRDLLTVVKTAISVLQRHMRLLVIPPPPSHCPTTPDDLLSSALSCASTPSSSSSAPPSITGYTVDELPEGPVARDVTHLWLENRPHWDTLQLLHFPATGIFDTQQVFIRIRPGKLGFTAWRAFEYFRYFGPVIIVRVLRGWFGNMFGFVAFNNVETVVDLLGRPAVHYLDDSVVAVERFRVGG